MTVRLKPVEDQVIVITGASSGIGLATARMAAERGARLVLVARNDEALQAIVREIEGKGGQALAVVADVARREDLERVAQAALRRFGQFDTWINNAAVALYGTVDEVPIEDQRRLFDVNYWGMVNGSLIAARHLRQRGGAIINTGSVLSDRAVPFQTQYSASKHAVKAFTDGLRMELEREGAPISVTLIKPSSIDTPYPEHARNYLDAPGLVTPPPNYDPRLVGKAILHAAGTPTRTLTVGFGGWIIGFFGAHFPRFTDYVMEAGGYAGQTTDTPGREARRDNLNAPREDGSERSALPGPPPRQTSLFLEAQLHPVVTSVALAGLGLLLTQVLRARSSRTSTAPWDTDEPAQRFRVAGAADAVATRRPKHPAKGWGHKKRHGKHGRHAGRSH